MSEDMELPNKWAIVKLGEIATYINGKAFKPSEWSKEGLPIIRIQNLNRKKSEFNYCNFSVDDKYYVNKGDLLFAWSGTPDTSFGAHIWSGKRAVLNQHIFRIVINENKITKQYYLYALNHKVKEFVSKAHGTAGLAHITKKKFEESEIALPPLPEQHCTVAKIEELFSELDNGIENLKKAREQLKTYRQAVLKYAFEGKLTKEWRNLQRRAGNPPEPAEKLLKQIRTEREKHYQRQLEDWKKACEQAKADGKKKPVKPKKPKELPPLTGKELAELPELSVGWVWAKLGCVVRKIFDGPFGSNLKTQDYVEKGVRVIRLENIGVLDFINEKKSYISKEKYNLIKKHKVFSGDIIFSSFISEEIRVIILPSYIKKAINKADCFCIRVAKSSLCNKYLAFYLSTKSTYNHLIHQVHGATRPRINTTQLRNCCIPLCSNHEQQQIVREIESRLSVCDKLEQTIEDSLKKAEALRQSILKKAFAGELTKYWREKHPELITGENSAEKLLEKIKAEKARAIESGKKPRSKKMKSKKSQN